MTAAPAVGRPRFKRSAASSPARLERPTDALSTLPFRRPAMTPTPVLNRALERLHGSIAREVPFAHKSTPRGAVCATQAHVRAPPHSGATCRVPSSLVDGAPALPTFNASEPSAVMSAVADQSAAFRAGCSSFQIRSNRTRAAAALIIPPPSQIMKPPISWSSTAETDGNNRPQRL